MRLSNFALSALASLALFASTSALAGTLTVNGQGWFVDSTMAKNVPATTSGLGTADFTFDASSTVFHSTSNYSVLGFLLSGGAYDIAQASGPSISNHNSMDVTGGTIFEFTGLGYFVNGQSYTITHDDGVQLYIGGDLVLSAPHKTSSETQAYTYLGPTGNAGFDFIYGECCGAPAVFNDPVAAPTPEPASMLLFGTGLLGLAAAARRKFSSR